MMNVLDVSVLTSSSERDLSNLLYELLFVSHCHLIDLYVLRPVDLFELGVDTPLLPYLNNLSSEEKICHWLKTRIDEANEFLPQTERSANSNRSVQIAALATFFPEISNSDTGIGNDAVNALSKCIKIAHQLKSMGIMRSPIVEMVCGPTSEHLPFSKLNAECRLLLHEYLQDEATRTKTKILNDTPETIINWDGFAKRRLLMDRLLEVYERVRDVEEWVVALELEPGHYVLNDSVSLRHIFLELLEEPKYEKLRSHVALNMDIAHMKIAGVTPADVRDLSPWIAHAHVCDHPGMHTRDQVLGTWEPAERINGSFYKYLEVYHEAISKRLELRLPVSGTVAIELEGCNRIMWIHDCVVALRHIQRSFESRMANHSTH